jgi:NAD(P)-dependent dehydrogenase (short-subunit alcohol dehydrogenase family)
VAAPDPSASAGRRTIFVTGAASGIGRATAELFAKRGWFVGLFDLDDAGVRALAERLDEAHGTRASCALGLDVTDEASFEKAMLFFADATREAVGEARIDVLFNSAGVLRMGRFEDVSVADARLQLEVNVMGVVIGIRAALPLLTRGSCIVTMSSASAIYGVPELAVYSASKFAVRALTEALDLELRSRGIRVCDVMPGYVDTPMVSSQTYRAKSLGELGVRLGAGDVASVVWEAVHGRKLHWIPQRDVALLARLGGLLPELGRAVMRRYSKM